MRRAEPIIIRPMQSPIQTPRAPQSKRKHKKYPAGNPIRANGSSCSVARAPTCNAEARNHRIATIGRAKPVTWVPNWLTLWADHSFRKSWCLNKLRGAGRNLPQVWSAAAQWRRWIWFSLEATT